MIASVSSQEGPYRSIDIFAIEWMVLIDPRMLRPTTFTIRTKASQRDSLLKTRANVIVDSYSSIRPGAGFHEGSGGYQSTTANDLQFSRTRHLLPVACCSGPCHDFRHSFKLTPRPTRITNLHLTPADTLQHRQLSSSTIETSKRIA